DTSYAPSLSARRARYMKLTRAVPVATVLLCVVPVLGAAPPTPAAHRPPTAAEILAASTAADWRALDPQNTLYLELPTGRVVIELAPEFAPNHVPTYSRSRGASTSTAFPSSARRTTTSCNGAIGRARTQWARHTAPLLPNSSVRYAACHSSGFPTLTP